MWDSKPDRANVPPACPQLNPLKSLCKGLNFVKIRTKSILPLVSVSIVDCKSLRSSVITQTLACMPFLFMYPRSLLLSPPNLSRVLLGAPSQISHLIGGQASQSESGCHLRNLTLALDPSCFPIQLYQKLVSYLRSTSGSGSHVRKGLRLAPHWLQQKSPIHWHPLTSCHILSKNPFGLPFPCSVKVHSVSLYWFSWKYPVPCIKSIIWSKW